MMVDPTEPAFPSAPATDIYTHRGMPVRLFIAAQIMAAIASCGESDTPLRDGETIAQAVKPIAKAALEWADALIEAHNRSIK